MSNEQTSMNKTCPTCGGYIGSVVICPLPYAEGNIPPINICTCHLVSTDAQLWPNVPKPTPEEVKRRQTEIAVQVKQAEARQARIENILARLGGRKEQELGDGHYRVAYDVDDEVTVSIAGENNSFDMENQISFSPQAALSLLAWLEQERPVLKQLAKGE